MNWATKIHRILDFIIKHNADPERVNYNLIRYDLETEEDTVIITANYKDWGICYAIEKLGNEYCTFCWENPYTIEGHEAIYKELGEIIK